MSNKFGPTRADLKFRLIFSVCGLALVAGALLFRGLPTGPAGWEALGISILFFGGTCGWTGWKLIKGDHS